MLDLRGGSSNRPSIDTDSAKALFQSITAAGKDLWDRHVVKQPPVPPPRVPKRPGPVDHVKDLAQSAEDRRWEFAQLDLVEVLTFISSHPQRAVRLTVTAWLVAEALAASGLLGEDVEIDVKVRKAWSKLEPGVELYKARLQHWWKRFSRWWKSVLDDPTRLEHVEDWPPRYQWAAGAAVGMVVAPVVLAVGQATLKLSLVGWLASEVSHYSKRYPEWLELLQAQPWLAKVDRWLEPWRLKCREFVEDPVGNVHAFWKGVDSRITDSIPVPVNVLRGMAAGIALGILIAV